MPLPDAPPPPPAVPTWSRDPVSDRPPRPAAGAAWRAPAELAQPRRPNLRVLAQCLGSEAHRRWEELVQLIADGYPALPPPAWVFAGPRGGWYLWFGRDRSLCALLPARGHFLVRIVLTGREQPAAEALLPVLRTHVGTDYRCAPRRGQAKWVSIAVDDDDVLGEVKRLIAAKAPPRAVAGA